ncbi:MAG: putative toxin-antitoxin system toxin component, PIN family [Xanthomonadales bacterium]|nr:putative toxin-antitoxin system toxin component, PIN family [Xanthomonadales bacterium]
MKVFVDTNVWLAGRFSRGLCAELLDALLELSAEIMLDERVLAEFHRIARDKFSVDSDVLDEAERFFRRYTEVLASAAEPCTGIPDPDDVWIVAAALDGGADWFVTGDKALLDLGRVRNLVVLSPRDAYTHLRGLN